MKNKTLKKLLLLLCLVLVPGVQAAAQDWKSILQGVASAVGDKTSEKLAEKIDTFTVTGSWRYINPDVKFESDDLLSKAGSELAAKKAEDRLVDVLNKIGINERTVFTFNSDSTYTIRTDKRTLHGTYSLNKETREIQMMSRLRLKFTAKVERNILKPNNMSILFKAEKLMSLVKNVTGTIAKKSTNKSIAMANTLLNKYDGLTLGMELKNPR